LEIDELEGGGLSASPDPEGPTPGSGQGECPGWVHNKVGATISLTTN